MKGLVELNFTHLRFMNAKIPFFVSLTIFVLTTSVVSAFEDEPVNISDEELKEILEEDDPNEIQISF